VFGHAWDEPEHLAVGMVLLERGEYRYDNQHPPLGRLAAALGPHLGGARLPTNLHQPGEEIGRQILYHSPIPYERVLSLARAGMLPFLAVLIIGFWLWVRRDHGSRVAWLGLALLLCTPPILGAAGVVALDMPVTALCVVSFWLLQRWIAQPTAARATALGLVAGLAVGTKISAVPFIALAGFSLLCAQALMQDTKFRWRAYLGGTALASVLVVLVSVGLYGPYLVYLITPALPTSSVLDSWVGHSGWLHDAGYQWAAHWRVPLGVREVSLNILGIQWHNDHGHPAYLLGHINNTGWWYFYPVALAVKTPLPLLLLGVPGLGWLAWRGVRQRNLGLLAAPLIFVVLLTFCCLYSHINIGVRHVLVLYPLLAVGAAAGSAALWRHWLSSMTGVTAARVGLPAMAALLLWQFSTLLTAYPDYLAYFNTLAGAHPENILVDSDLDWGQDLRRLALELARRKVTQVALVYNGSADLSREHLPPFQLLAAGQQASGWIALSLLRSKESTGGYEWLTRQPPVMRVGKSIDLYYVPPPGGAAAQ